MKWWRERRGKFVLISLLFVAAIIGIVAQQSWFHHVRKRDAFYTSSCANHFIQLRLGLIVLAEDGPDLVLPAIADTRRAFSLISTNHFGPLDGYNSACAESYLRDKSIGYLYVGDGLRLGDVAEKEILILFCPGENHRGSSEHCHGFSLSKSAMCASSNGVMIAELERAIARGESGEVAYSERAMKVLRRELEKRRQPVP